MLTPFFSALITGKRLDTRHHALPLHSMSQGFGKVGILKMAVRRRFRKMNHAPEDLQKWSRLRLVTTGKYFIVIYHRIKLY